MEMASQVVLRYPIREPVGQCMVATIPRCARVIKAGERPADGEPSAWALMPNGDHPSTKRVVLAGTGCELPDIAPGYYWHHVDTWFTGPFVFHAFVEEVGSP